MVSYFQAPARSRPIDIARYVCALANDGGGHLDLSGSPDACVLLLRDAEALLHPPVRVLAATTPDTPHPGLRVKVEGRRRALGPVFVGGRQVADAYCVQHGRIQPLVGDDLLEWQREAGVATDELAGRASQRAPRALDPDRLSALCAALQVQPSDAPALRAIGVYMTSGIHPRPTIAADVALGAGARVELRHTLASLAHAAERGGAPAHATVCTGLLPVVLDQVQAATARALGDAAAPALREVLLNAVVHRSYAPANEARPVVVDIFTDAVKLTSPGPVLARVLRGKPTLGRAWCRNPTLQRMLQALGELSATGQGLSPLLQGAFGLQPLQLRSDPDSVSVTLRSAGRRAALPPAPRRRPKTEARKDEVVAQIEAHGPLGRAQLEELLGLGRARVNQLLAELVEEGRLVPERDAPRSRLQRYHLPSPCG